MAEQPKLFAVSDSHLALQEMLRAFVLLKGSISAHLNAEALQALKKAYEVLSQGFEVPELPEKSVSLTQPTYHAYHARSAIQRALLLFEGHMNPSAPETVLEVLALIKESYELL
ncbi:hypothetical protein [Deinococcus misasensis]|uniref:hypothetical protein n=1 Tax=Deinococcus misasensis TaxID=392413 RepID=UPI0005563063|nr:hypothetical protein [Deinococcus misasensis]